MKKKRLTYKSRFIVDADYLDFFLSAYYRQVIKNDHLPLCRGQRWSFIKEELAKSLKRKTYGKTYLHESEIEKE